MAKDEIQKQIEILTVKMQDKFVGDDEFRKLWAERRELIVELNNKRHEVKLEMK